MLNLNPLQDWYKPSGYSKWYHFIWAMPLLFIFMTVFKIGFFFRDMIKK